MSFLGGIISGAIGSAVSSAIKNSSNKNKGSSGSSSSQSTSVSNSGSSSKGVSGSASNGLMSKPTYDANADYQAQINKAVASNNYAQAAILEQQRNQKIKDMGLSYGQTSLYGKYLNGSTQNAETAQQAGHTIVDWNPKEAPYYGENQNHVDYQALIKDAVNQGNLAQAAILEQQRNDKIEAQGLSYGKTNLE